MSQPFKLFRLQGIDSQLDRVRARLNEIEIQLREEEALRLAEQRFAEALTTLEEKRKRLKQAEQEVHEQRIKIEQNESTLYGGKVRNPKELQDLQNEGAALKRYRNVLEDRQLESMIELEEAEAIHQTQKTELERVQTELAQKQKMLKEGQESLRNEAARLESERQAAASSIPKEDLDLYSLLRKQRNGIAVAKVSDKACSACGSTLNAALLHAVRSPSQITRCATCGRILYGG